MAAAWSYISKLRVPRAFSKYFFAGTFVAHAPKIMQSPCNIANGRITPPRYIQSP